MNGKRASAMRTEVSLREGSTGKIAVEGQDGPATSPTQPPRMVSEYRRAKRERRLAKRRWLYA